VNHDDFAVEPIPGLPARPPEGERILWQGAPSWRMVARRVFHVRLIAAYFAVAAAWRVATVIEDGTGAWDAFVSLGLLALFGAVVAGFFLLWAWAVARTSVYTITSKRLVMRIGVALPVTFNLPFERIESASLRLYPDGSGDIPLTLMPGEHLAWLVLWPHARPWRMRHPEPMLRCVPDAQAVAQILGQAFAAAVPARTLREGDATPARAPVPAQAALSAG
jgi:hypothetical protein